MTQLNKEQRIRRRAERKVVMGRLALHGWRFVSHWVVAHEVDVHSFDIIKDAREFAAKYRTGVTWPDEAMNMAVIPNKNFWILANAIIAMRLA